MNKAESARIAGYLDAAGLEEVSRFEEADLVVLNTCVVRQSAEDKVLGTLGMLKGLRQQRPSLSIVVTGCFVNSNHNELCRRFPHVDLFFGPGDYRSLERWMNEATDLVLARPLPCSPRESLLPKLDRDRGRKSPSAYVPVIQGCDKFCSYCIVPYRRGRESSRPPEDVVHEVTKLVQRGVREVTLLGQNIASYGHDLALGTDLAELLGTLNRVEGLTRIRFLTSHPRDVSDRLIDAVASLDKVCEHFDVALQSGHDEVLSRMRRGYSVEQFCDVVQSIRDRIPGVSLNTDVIVGFPGETEEQFAHTYHLLASLRFDVVHCAAYSPRAGTIAARRYCDDVSLEVKRRRVDSIERLQEQMASEINAGYEGCLIWVLVEGRKRDRWYGRTRTDKLVFFEDGRDLLGELVQVRVTEGGPWALKGVPEAYGV
jgi:tRNA-2-methylthio-N6-dimethylallyladenosine synthase